MASTEGGLFKGLETAAAGTTLPFDVVAEQLRFNAAGLIPAITQEAATGEVLMLAWMHRQALEQTLDTGKVTYWSRSRQALWLKGETSGHYQRLVSLRIDCDGDAVLCSVEQTGGAATLGARAVFTWRFSLLGSW